VLTSNEVAFVVFAYENSKLGLRSKL